MRYLSPKQAQRHLRAAATLAVVALVALATEALGQQGRLMGRVLDNTGKPIAGATVYITSASVTQAAVSNAQGYYTFLSVPPENYKIRTYKRGYDAWNSEVAVVAGSITRIDVKLGVGGSDENLAVAEAQKPTTSTAVKKTVPVVKKKEVEVVAASETPVVANETIELKNDIIAQLKSEGDDDEKGAEALIRLTEENLNADDIEQTATLESNIEIVGGLEKLYQSVKYPELALKAGAEGKAIAQVFVDKEGSVLKVNFLKSINPILDAEVMRVLTEDTQFKPARVSGGKPVPGAIVIPFTFKIKK
ncbi:MAG: TonB family protein [Chloroherpetonaceae bacterium]|nr:TonB family protein [Chloroherpetonaceae bacterium]MDW8437977.1 TonB family protein [Chloroherpetonaceae bacterium]